MPPVSTPTQLCRTLLEGGSNNRIESISRQTSPTPSPLRLLLSIPYSLNNAAAEATEGPVSPTLPRCRSRLIFTGSFHSVHTRDSIPYTPRLLLPVCPIPSSYPSGPPIRSTSPYAEAQDDEVPVVSTLPGFGRNLQQIFPFCIPRGQHPLFPIPHGARRLCVPYTSDCTSPIQPELVRLDYSL